VSTAPSGANFPKRFQLHNGAWKGENGSRGMSTEPTSSGSPAPVREGDILASKYRVEKVLGVGGMGVVVAAEHLELGQKVALKFLLKQAAANDDLVGRFLREARASVRLKGSHVAKTLDVGRLDDGCPYIVMEFLEGHDLHAEIRAAREPLAIEDAVSYVVQAAEGLAEAHSLGIVHRDLKPGNLFLTRGVDGRPLVKVLDFGISKTMDPGAGGDGLSLTKTEMLLGSPLYMSPEQMRSSKHVDERSDLWALGAIAFELLTGKVPFEADTLLELCFKVAQEKVPSPKLLRADLPDELCAAVIRCLEKEVDKRFANVGELALAFEPFALPRDRGTAQRALDVLGAGKRPPMRSVPDIAETSAPGASPSGAVVVGASSSGASQSGAAAVAASSSAARGLGDSGTPAAAPAPGVPQTAPSEPVAAAAWGTTQANAATRSKKGLVAVVAGVLLVASLGGVFAARSGAGASPAALVAPAANANANAPAPATGGDDDPSTRSATEILAAPPTTGVVPSPTVDEAGAAASPPPAAGGPASGKPARPSVAAVVAAPSSTVRGAKPASAASATSAAASAKTAPPASAAPGGFLKVRE
jgi:eukaryotic-like serine/threonine-protein kinase